MSELAVPPCQFWQGLTNIKNRIISNYLCIPPAPSYAPACPLWVVSFCQFRKNRLPKKVKKATKSARNPPPPPAKKNIYKKTLFFVKGKLPDYFFSYFFRLRAKKVDPIRKKIGGQFFINKKKGFNRPYFFVPLRLHKKNGRHLFCLFPPAGSTSFRPHALKKAK